MKLSYIVSLFLFSAKAAEIKDDDECSDDTFQCNNQTIIVDEYLNFTWSTDLMYTNDMYNLVETPDEEDVRIPVINGHFELSGWPEDIEITQDSSFRFCMQYWKKFDDSGAEVTDAFGEETSARNRLRFFNKKMSEFAFYPQLARAQDGLVEINGQKVNPDWGNVVDDRQIQNDDNKAICHRGFYDVEEENRQFYGVSTGNVDYLVPDAEVGDTMGIAVLKQIINLSEKTASVSFMRPLEAISEWDTNFEEDTTYQVYINWGIFQDHEDSNVTRVQGHTNPVIHSEEMIVMSALSATSLLATFMTFISMAAIEL